MLVTDGTSLGVVVLAAEVTRDVERIRRVAIMGFCDPILSASRSKAHTKPFLLVSVLT